MATERHPEAEKKMVEAETAHVQAAIPHPTSELLSQEPLKPLVAITG
jgi:hypothetical protein